jgi:hypothetical protein
MKIKIGDTEFSLNDLISIGKAKIDSDGVIWLMENGMQVRRLGKVDSPPIGENSNPVNKQILFG